MSNSKPMRIILAIPLLLTLPVLVGCNTTAGVGKDLKAAGSAIEKSADKEKSY